MFYYNGDNIGQMMALILTNALLDGVILSGVVVAAIVLLRMVRHPAEEILIDESFNAEAIAAEDARWYGR